MPRLLQERLEPLLEFKKIKGVDNLTEDNTRLPPGFFRVCSNVDIDSEEMAHRRKGILQLLISGASHSLWSDEGSLCFAVVNGNLVQINTDWTLTTLLNQVGASWINYVKVVDRVFFGNLTLVGYIKDANAYAFPEPTRIERQKMVGGELIEFYNGAFWAAQGGVIYSSIPGRPFETDRKKLFLPVGGPITMLKAVDDGLYVSAGDKVAFFQGPNILSLKYHHKLDVPALRGSPLTIERLDLGSKGVPMTHHGLVGKAILFHTSIGVFMGLKGGYVKDCTSDHYAEYDLVEGSSVMKWYNGYRQYVYMGRTAGPITIGGSALLPPIVGTGGEVTIGEAVYLPSFTGTGEI
jgi:hypothetical protein